MQCHIATVGCDGHRQRLRFRAPIAEPKVVLSAGIRGPVSAHLRVVAPGNPSCAFPCEKGLSASWRFVFGIVYGLMFWCCLVCSLSLLLLATKRGRSGRTFSGVPVLLPNLECYCVPGGGYLGGGASAPRYQGPPERLSREAGRPMGPSTPPCFSQSCAFVCLVSC